MDRWFFEIKRVEQGDWNGCGIGATATVCGVSYERARHEFFPRRKVIKDDKRLWVSAQAMLKVIQRLGFTVEFRKENPCDVDLPVVTFLSYHLPGRAYPGDPNACHAVVWDPFKKRFLDPGPNQEHNTNAYYAELWKNNKYDSIVLTGKRKKRA